MIHELVRAGIPDDLVAFFSVLENDDDRALCEQFRTTTALSFLEPLQDAIPHGLTGNQRNRFAKDVDAPSLIAVIIRVAAKFGGAEVWSNLFGVTFAVVPGITGKQWSLGVFGVEGPHVKVLHTMIFMDEVLCGSLAKAKQEGLLILVSLSGHTPRLKHLFQAFVCEFHEFAKVIGFNLLERPLRYSGGIHSRLLA